MPCTVKVRVIEARNLPVMDRSSDLTDAYVELRFLDSVKKTEIRRKTLNPIWNEDFRFEVPQDSQLQDHPIKLKVYDHDVVSADDVIGTIHVDLNCLLNKSGGQIAGWFPIFDTLRGIRGDLNIVVKVELFGDVNEFREASTGVQFIASSKPELFHEIVESQGLVAYIVVKSDPEYHWMDNFRASRISNEERQLLLYNLSGKLRRHIGKKAIEMGGNTVLGYNQYFDLEGENGIVARGYGTCCTTKDIREGGINTEDASPLVPKKIASLNIPHSGSLENMSTILSTPEIKDNMMNSSNFPVKLLTLNNFEIEDVERFGGIVIARSVKYLSHAKSSSAKGGKKLRNEWWQEIREEIRTHARFFGCDTVIGYHEMFTMDCDKEICVLTAVGTAAMMSSKYSGPIFNDQTSTATREEKIKRK
ncbi:C2 calcium-dependent membrane targeting domain-containing protein, partial [Planoprotostelium fungivorum]